MKKGKFIVFEGIDGLGKSTISNMLFEKINSHSGNIYKTFEPTDSHIGSVIKNILNKRIISDDKTIGALFLADRLVKEIFDEVWRVTYKHIEIKS